MAAQVLEHRDDTSCSMELVKVNYQPMALCFIISVPNDSVHIVFYKCQNSGDYEFVDIMVIGFVSSFPYQCQ